MPNTLLQPPTECHRLPALSPRLDTLETTLSPRIPLIDSNGNRKKNVLAARLILTSDWEDKEMRARRIMDCGTYIRVKNGENGPYLAANRCRDRLCPECAKLKQLELARTITERLKDYYRPKFVTFTLKHTKGDLGEQITRVLKSFARLRSRAIWKQSVTRGIYAVEWHRSQNTDCWHAHIHCLIDGNYIAKKWLQTAWLEITGDSFIVDIRTATDKAPGYIAKYMAKAVTTETLTEELWPVAMQLKGRRLCGKFGKERPLNEDKDPCEDEDLGSLHDVIEKAKDGDPAMIRVLQQLCVRYGVQVPFEIRLPVDDT